MQWAQKSFAKPIAGTQGCIYERKWENVTKIAFLRTRYIWLTSFVNNTFCNWQDFQKTTLWSNCSTFWENLYFWWGKNRNDRNDTRYWRYATQGLPANVNNTYDDLQSWHQQDMKRQKEKITRLALFFNSSVSCSSKKQNFDFTLVLREKCFCLRKGILPSYPFTSWRMFWFTILSTRFYGRWQKIVPLSFSITTEMSHLFEPKKYLTQVMRKCTHFKENGVGYAYSVSNFANACRDPSPSEVNSFARSSTRSLQFTRGKTSPVRTFCVLESNRLIWASFSPVPPIDLFNTAEFHDWSQGVLTILVNAYLPHTALQSVWNPVFSVFAHSEILLQFYRNHTAVSSLLDTVHRPTFRSLFDSLAIIV